jgi:hypothetical protein
MKKVMDRDFFFKKEGGTVIIFWNWDPPVSSKNCIEFVRSATGSRVAEGFCAEMENVIWQKNLLHFELLNDARPASTNKTINASLFPSQRSD